MKATMVAALLTVLTACAGVQDPWHWLEEPEMQEWQKVKIEGYPLEVSFSFPDRPRLGAQQPRIVGDWEMGEDGYEVKISPDEFLWPYIRYFNVTWDWYWGGFYKEGIEDVSLSVATYHLEHDVDLLGLTPEQRINLRIDDYRERYQNGSEHSASYFWENFWIKEYENPNGVVFVVQNSPNSSADHQYFSIPVSNTHRLKFSFFVSDKRMGREIDPEWNQSRWDLVYKIMDTVEILPAASASP